MSNTDHGHHVLDQIFPGQGKSKADILKPLIEDEGTVDHGNSSRLVLSLRSSSPPTTPVAGEPTMQGRNITLVDDSNNASTISSPPQSPLQNIKDDAKSYPEGGLRAWLVVLGSFSGMTASFGLMNTVGTFQVYLSTHQLASYSPSAIGWIFSLYVFLSFFCGVQIGPVFDAKGPRWIVVLGTICLLAGMVGVACSTGMF